MSLKKLIKKNNLKPSSYSKNKESFLFDQTDKAFLLLYLIIFVLGIILTIKAI